MSNIYLKFYFQKLVDFLQAYFAGYICKFNIDAFTALNLKTHPAKGGKLLKILKKHLYFQYFLVDICVSDSGILKKNRFKMQYVLLSYKNNSRLRVIQNLAETTAVSTVSFLFLNAGWLEREIWEMFGVFFKNNINLRRLLTDYGFNFNPLRKDFPVVGFEAIVYSDLSSKLLKIAVEDSQVDTSFKFTSWWKL